MDTGAVIFSEKSFQSMVLFWNSFGSLTINGYACMKNLNGTSLSFKNWPYNIMLHKTCLFIIDVLTLFDFSRFFMSSALKITDTKPRSNGHADFMFVRTSLVLRLLTDSVFSSCGGSRLQPISNGVRSKVFVTNDLCVMYFGNTNLFVVTATVIVAFPRKAD